MKVGLLAVAFILIFIIAWPVQGNTEGPVKYVTQNQELTDLTDRILQYTDANQTDAAKSLLSSFDKKWKALMPVYSEPDWRTVEADALQLRFQLDSDVSSQAMHENALSLRLCVDALTGGGAPLWKDMKDQVLSTVMGMKQAIDTRDQADFQSRLNDFLDLYAIIYPSLVIDGPNDQVQMINQAVTGLENSRSAAVNDKVRMKQLNLIEIDMSRVFGQNTPSGNNNMIPLIAIISSFLILSLCYVSWKKYTERRFAFK